MRAPPLDAWSTQNKPISSSRTIHVAEKVQAGEDLSLSGNSGVNKGAMDSSKHKNTADVSATVPATKKSRVGSPI